MNSFSLASLFWMIKINLIKINADAIKMAFRPYYLKTSNLSFVKLLKNLLIFQVQVLFQVIKFFSL